MRVFLSYAAKDEPIAEVVREHLKDAGFTVWDPAYAAPVENWALEHGRQLERTEAVVALLSPSGVASRAVQSDIDYALGAKRLKKRLIPVVVRPVARIPWILKELDLVDIAADAKKGSRRIVQALRRAQNAA